MINRINNKCKIVNIKIIKKIPEIIKLQQNLKYYKN